MALRDGFQAIEIIRIRKIYCSIINVKRQIGISCAMKSERLIRHGNI